MDEINENNFPPWLMAIAELDVSTLALKAVFTGALLYCSSYVYCLLRNLYNGRKTGFPSIVVPWDQNSWFWMVASVPLRPICKRYMPTWMYSRLALTIYSWEYQERLKPFRKAGTYDQPAPAFNLVTPGRFEIWIRDREVAAEVLRRYNDFQQFELTTLFMSRFGRNVLTEDGAIWARHRKVVASVINERISKSVFSETLKQTEGMVNEIFAIQEKEAVTVGAFDMMKKITIHVLSGAGMGISAPWDNKEAEKPKDGFKMTYMSAINVLVVAIAGPIILPLWFLDNYPKSFPGAEFMRSLGVAVKEFPMHTMNMLNGERNNPARSSGESKQQANIMSQLIAASEQPNGGISTSNAKSRALSDEEMIGNLFIFTVAGFDTTANTLSYSLVLLARHPQWQDWILEEIDAICPPTEDIASWDYAAIYPKATRVMAFMFETLRLFPPLVHEVKTTHVPQTVTTSKGQYWFPARTTVYVNNCSLHLDAEVWRDLNQSKPGDGMPAAGRSPFIAVDGEVDEAMFRPGRWIDRGSGELFRPPRGAYLPWSTGSRNCPGQKMAQVEFTAVFLRLLRDCRVEAEPIDVEVEGKKRKEARPEVEARLDKYMREAISLLTLQMEGIYNPDESEGEGLKLRMVRR